MNHTSESINQPITTAEVERFLVDEAALLDELKSTERLEVPPVACCFVNAARSWTWRP